KDQRILFLGAGSAAIGLANLIVSALGQQGVAAEVARRQIWMFDTQGLVVAGRPGLAPHKLPYAHKLPPSKPFNHLDPASECPQIVAAIEDFKPTALIGVSGKALPLPPADCSPARSSRRWHASTRGPSSLPCPTRPRTTNVCPSRPTPG